MPRELTTVKILNFVFRKLRIKTEQHIHSTGLERLNYLVRLHNKQYCEKASLGSSTTIRMQMLDAPCTTVMLLHYNFVHFGLNIMRINRVEEVYFPQSGSENQLFTFDRCMSLPVVNAITT